jgi:hypothetical protein
LGLGYVGEKNAEELHEFASLDKGPVHIEIHRYFPVWSYAQDFDRYGYFPEEHLGLWVQNNALASYGRLLYSDVRNYLSFGLTPDTQDLKILEPTMAVFILCAHEFRNYILASLGRYTLNRLNVMADILALTRHPDFDIALFQSFVQKFSGEDSTSFVGYLLNAFFGVDPFSSLHKSPIAVDSMEGCPPFPRLLSSEGFWVAIGDLNHYLLPQSIVRIASDLQSDTITANKTGEPRAFYHTLSESDQALRSKKICCSLQRTIIQSKGDDHIDAAVSVSWNRGTLDVQVAIRADLRAEQIYDIKLYSRTGKDVSYWARFNDAVVEEDGNAPKDSAAHGVVLREADRYCFTVCLPLHETPLLESDAGFPLLLLLAKKPLNARRLFDAYCFLVAPLQVRCVDVTHAISDISKVAESAH